MIFLPSATVTDNIHGTIPRYPSGSPATPFDYGSGHLSPIAAINPGLVYDYDLNEMLDFLCSNGATSAELRNITGKAISCTGHTTQTYNLNYPSIAVSNVTGKISVYRTVKNCHSGYWAYNVSVENPSGIMINVVPSKLVFSEAGEKKRFRVDIIPSTATNGSFVFGAVTWRDGVHTVRSPVALSVISV